jgi:ubiquinone/menaquinone biosynthesis C-methylase UbiE
MPKLFWTGKLSFPMFVVANANNILAWLAGNSGKTAEMTERVKRGYDGLFSDHVRRYDALGLKLQMKAARAQLEEVEIAGAKVLDVGCGTGALSFLALERGAAHVTCGDISAFMLDEANRKVTGSQLDAGRVAFKELDAQSLPFPDDTFDVVMTGMSMGLFPDQTRAVSEMVRVCKPGGLLCVGAHGPEHYWEAVDGCFRAIPKRYVLGYRLEYWPQSENGLRKMMSRCGIEQLRFKRVIWRNIFPTGGEALDFFAAITASFWYAKVPKEKVGPVAEKTRRYFVDHGIVQVTDDVIFGYGVKAAPERRSETAARRRRVK